MKRIVIIIGLICEFFACSYVPMKSPIGSNSTTYEVLGYYWIWHICPKYSICSWSTPDIPRLVIGMLAIAILTAIFYLIFDKKE